MKDLPVSGNRMYRPVAFLATGFLWKENRNQFCLDFSPVEVEECKLNLLEAIIFLSDFSDSLCYNKKD
ncbi:hypothetical protein D8884_06865 [Streptococcus sanguinis]|nr:hypothetical protein D8889_10365 [Streptococcus sanguinis]RSI18024.1 hypothetical protein D8884_06865 [Streptococcus sanguinis]